MKRFRLFDDIWVKPTEDFSEFINHVEAGESIQIDVMSYGGDVFSGLAIAEMLLEARKRAIHSSVVIYGIAASAAAIMALAADHVVMTEIGSLMLHGVYQETWDGKIIKKGDDIDRANAVCLSIIQRRCPSYTMDMLLAKDNWYSAAEAKELGLIDEVRPLDDFAKDMDLKNMLSRLLNMATHASKPNGGNKMSKSAKNDLDEKDVETQIEEQEKKELENDEGDATADESDLKTLIVDGFNAILDRLAAIEAMLAPKDVEANGNGEDEKKDDDIMAAKIRAMYERIGKVSKPCARPVREEKTDKEAEVKAAAERVKTVFPNIAKYYAEN